MQKSIFTSFLILTLFAFSANSNDEKPWGLVEASYNVSSSKLVTKDLGTLQVRFALSCVESPTDVDKRIQSLRDSVNQEIQRVSSFSLLEKSSETSVSSYDRYDIRYDEKDVNRLNPHYVDICNDNARVDLTAGPVNLTDKVFRAQATAQVETDKDLAKLIVLRQRLQLYAVELNKSLENEVVSVGNERIVVSEVKSEKTREELKEQNRLTGEEAKETGLLVDREVSGGFEELYITSVDTASRADYIRYQPTLTEDGRSKVSVPYTFQIEYIPSDLIEDGNNKDMRGELIQPITGTAVVETDYYIASLNLSTVCHATEAKAVQQMAGVFEAFNTKARAVVDLEANSPYERTEENIGRPEQDRMWIPWEKEIVSAPNNSSRDQVIAKSYLSRCTGKVQAKVTKEDQTFKVVTSIRLVTKNFEGLKELSALANSFTQKQRDQKLSDGVEVQLSRISPKLKDAKLFNVVEVQTYQNALKQLTDPAGQVASILLDEIQAGEAYYSVAKEGTPRGGRAPSPSARPEAMVLDEAPDFSVILTSEDSIPMEELRVDQTYNVLYRPTKDLVQILNDNRAISTNLP